MIHLVYYGDDLYKRSGTAMSALYTETGQRYDYGFMQRDLANGHEVHIRQATPTEQSLMLQTLAEVEKRLRERVQ